MRARYEVSVVNLKLYMYLYSVLVNAVVCEISCYTGLRYNGTRTVFCKLCMMKVIWIIILMAHLKTAVTPVCQQWSYHSLALSHQSNDSVCWLLPVHRIYIVKQKVEIQETWAQKFPLARSYHFIKNKLYIFSLYQNSSISYSTCTGASFTNRN